MGSGLGQFAPFLPLLALMALVITAVRRRKEKKKRFAERPTKASVIVIMAMGLTGPMSEARTLGSGHPCEGHLVEANTWIADVHSGLQEGVVRYIAMPDYSKARRSIYVLEACQSGKMLVARTSEQRSIGDGWTEIGEIDDLVWDMVTAPEAYTFSQLRQRLQQSGFDARLRTSVSESCVCSLDYPDLRGAKTPYGESR